MSWLKLSLKNFQACVRPYGLTATRYNTVATSWPLILLSSNTYRKSLFQIFQYKSSHDYNSNEYQSTRTGNTNLFLSEIFSAAPRAETMRSFSTGSMEFLYLFHRNSHSVSSPYFMAVLYTASRKWASIVFLYSIKTRQRFVQLWNASPITLKLLPIFLLNKRSKKVKLKPKQNKNKPKKATQHNHYWRVIIHPCAEFFLTFVNYILVTMVTQLHQNEVT